MMINYYSKHLLKLPRKENVNTRNSKMINKDILLSALVTFSTYQHPLDVRYFHQHYSMKGERLHDFRRTIANLIREIQSDQIYLQKINRPYMLVFSSPNGYYVAKNRKEALAGRDFYYSRAKQIIEFTKKFDALIDNVYPEPEQQTLF